MKKKYTQKKITRILRRRGIFLNNKKVKNKLLLNKKILTKKLVIGIIAKRNKRLTQEEINTIKQDINNPKYITLGGKISKYFEIVINMKPNKIITSKGILVRMGKGKGKIKTKGIYILKNKVCIELIQKDINNKKIKNILINKKKNIFLSKFLKKYTLFKIITNQ